MSRPPLGQVCIELGLLSEEQVGRILGDMQRHGHGRFGELAVGLNLLSEEALARALAQQFHVPLLPVERVTRLDVPREVLRLLPVGLMRGRLLLPTYLDPDRRTLSVVTSDPTDLPALQTAQRHAQADRLRVFVAARSALVATLDRLLPPGTGGDAAGDDLATGAGGSDAGTVVLETDVEVASALRRLDRAEGGRAQVVQDPEQVTAMLRDGLADRVLYREAMADVADPYLAVWRKVRPGVQVAGIRGFGPGRRVAVGYRAARAFYQDLVLWLLGRQAGHGDVVARVRGAWRLAVEVGRQVQLGEEQVEAVALVAAMAEAGDVEGPSGPLPGLEAGPDLLARFSPPWDLAGLLAAIDRRWNRPAEVTEHLACELLLVVRHANRLGVAGRTDADDVLDPAVRYHPRVRAALSRVLQRRVLRAQLLTGGRRRATVVAASPDPLQLHDLDRALGPRGIELFAFSEVDPALAAIRSLRPSAVVLSLALAGDRPRRLLAEVRHDTPLADTPVLLLASGPAAEARALADLRPDAVLRPPHDADRVLAELLLRLAQPGTGPDRSASAMGDSSQIPMTEVLDILSAGRQTAMVQVAGAVQQGVLYVVDGAVQAARLGHATGEEARQEIMALEPVRYAVAFGRRPPDPDRPAAVPDLAIGP
ncbi:hypothetical protein L6R53_14175 [Myxococcota bacterium]|nr:hypothetical protein [Myxococcota bacterium]